MVGKVVLYGPGLATVSAPLAELADGVGCEVEELQMTLHARPAWLRNVVGPEVHYALLKIPEEEDHSLGVVDPELLPALERGVVGVVALARIGQAGRGPVLPDDAIAELLRDVAAAHRVSVGCADYVPVAHPEIELPALG